MASYQFIKKRFARFSGWKPSHVSPEGWREGPNKCNLGLNKPNPSVQRRGRLVLSFTQGAHLELDVLPEFHICTGTVTNDKNPEGGNYMTSGPWLRRNCWGQWVMFNKEKLSVADHDSYLQVNAGLSCWRGALTLFCFTDRTETSGKSLGRSKFLVNIRKNFLMVWIFLYLWFCKAMAPGKDSSRTRLSIHSDALRGNVCVDGKIELLNP